MHLLLLFQVLNLPLESALKKSILQVILMETVARIPKVPLPNVNPGILLYFCPIEEALKVVQMVHSHIVKLFNILSPLHLEILSVEKFSVKGERIDL